MSVFVRIHEDSYRWRVEAQKPVPIQYLFYFSMKGVLLCQNTRKKLKLDELHVESFVTSAALIGGAVYDDPNADTGDNVCWDEIMVTRGDGGRRKKTQCNAVVVVGREDLV